MQIFHWKFNLKSLGLSSLIASLALSQQALAFPIYAQQAYENPREANGRIACKTMVCFLLLQLMPRRPLKTTLRQIHSPIKTHQCHEFLLQ